MIEKANKSKLSGPAQVEPRDQLKVNSPIKDTEGNFREPVCCYWNGLKYSPGGKVCSFQGGAGNHQFICQSDGSWLDWGPC